MAENEKDFNVARLDQQIEHPTGSLDAKAQQLVRDLHRMGQPTQSDIRANAESLQRVERRLQARLKTEHQETTIVPLRVLQARQERKSFMQILTNERKPNPRRFSHILNTFVAVLAAALLIGSVAVLVVLRNHAQATQPNTNTGAPVTTAPQPKLDCSVVFSFDDDKTHTTPDNGEHSICEQGLEMPLNITKPLGGHTLTLISAYADTNRILVKFVTDGKGSLNDGVLLNLSLDGTQLNLGTESNLQYYDQQHNRTFQLYNFDTQDVPTGTTNLQLTALFSNVTDQGQVGSATVNFTLPLHTEKRVATPNQTLSINGYSFTLTNVVATASQTTLTLTPTQTIQIQETFGALGTLNGNGAIVVSNGGKFSSLISITVDVPADLLNTQGNWTLNLNSTGDPLGIGSGSVQFTVPR